jgi:hypothetical protein
MTIANISPAGWDFVRFLGCDLKISFQVLNMARPDMYSVLVKFLLSLDLVIPKLGSSHDGTKLEAILTEPISSGNAC